MAPREAEAGPSLLYAVKQVELITRARLDDLLAPAGITALQYTALSVLEHRDGLVSSELARNSFVTAQSMADLVGALLRRGLVIRDRDPGDRRRLLISLTDEGRALLTAYAAPVRALEERMLADFEPAERKALRSLLNRCRRNLGG
jgi:DNA-binding MarR family transcriptional regulator